EILPRRGPLGLYRAHELADRFQKSGVDVLELLKRGDALRRRDGRETPQRHQRDDRHHENRDDLGTHRSRPEDPRRRHPARRRSPGGVTGARWWRCRTVGVFRSLVTHVTVARTLIVRLVLAVTH